MMLMVNELGDPPEWRLTHALVFDHDGKKRSQPSDQSSDLQRALESKQMKHRSHMLWRKKQENYLPLEALVAIKTKKQANAGGGISRYRSTEPPKRYFKKLPETYKNGFKVELEWDDEWFKKDGCWPEMRVIAEMLAAAM